MYSVDFSLRTHSKHDYQYIAYTYQYNNKGSAGLGSKYNLQAQHWCWNFHIFFSVA